MKTIFRLACFAFSITSIAFAQQKLPYAVSFVAVGTSSDSYWVGDGPDMEVFAHDPGATPPAEIQVSSESKKKSSEGKKESDSKDKDKRQSLKLTLNNPTKHIWRKSNTCLLTARGSSGGEASYSEFTTARLPKKRGSYTVFLARQAKRKTWKNPQQIILSDSTIKFPLGSTRIVNCSDRPLLVQRGKKALGTLSPGKNVILKKILKLKSPEKITLWYQHKGRKIPVFRRALNYPTNQRLNITCTYVPKRSTPLGAQLFPTSIPAPPKKKKATVQ